MIKNSPHRSTSLRHTRGDTAAAPVASANILSAVFPEYPVHVEKTIRFHLRLGALLDFLMGSFDRIQLVAYHQSAGRTPRPGPKVIYVNSSPQPAKMWQRRRVANGHCVTWNPRKTTQLELAKYSLERGAGVQFRDRYQSVTLPSQF